MSSSLRSELVTSSWPQCGALAHSAGLRSIADIVLGLAVVPAHRFSPFSSPVVFGYNAQTLDYLKFVPPFIPPEV